jgi:hypothetical protein
MPDECELSLVCVGLVGIRERVQMDVAPAKPLKLVALRKEFHWSYKLERSGGRDGSIGSVEKNVRGTLCKRTLGRTRGRIRRGCRSSRTLRRSPGALFRSACHIWRGVCAPRPLGPRGPSGSEGLRERGWHTLRRHRYSGVSKLRELKTGIRTVYILLSRSERNGTGREWRDMVPKRTRTGVICMLRSEIEKRRS